MSMKNEHLQSLPSVDKLLNARDIQVLKESFGRSLVTEAVRNVLNKERESILKNNNVQVSNYNDLTNKIENATITSKTHNKIPGAIFSGLLLLLQFYAIFNTKWLVNENLPKDSTIMNIGELLLGKYLLFDPIIFIFPCILVFLCNILYILLFL